MFDNVQVKEVATTATAAHSARLQYRFLKGPIPLRDITTASRLGGSALALFLAVHHRCALTRRSTVTLPKQLLQEFGMSRDTKSRALRSLEAAGLILAQRDDGMSTRVTLVDTGRVQLREPQAEAAADVDALWQNKDWRVTHNGLAARHHQYNIGVSQLKDMRELPDGVIASMWPLHMAEKSWVDLESFLEAFENALQIHCPADAAKLNVVASYAAALADKNGKQMATAA